MATTPIVVRYAPMPSALLSNLGSLCILYGIFFQGARKRKLVSTYQRLLIGLSAFDVLSSTGILVFSPWAVPQDRTPGMTQAWPGGTVTTFAVAVFFLSLGHGHVQVLPQDENDPNRYRSVSFTVALCCKILFPLMGFWNALIYFHIGCSSRRRRRNKKRSHRSPSLVDHDDTPSAQNEKK